MGKTTIARKYLNQHSEEYDHIIWLQVTKGIRNAFTEDVVLRTHFKIETTNIDESFQLILNELINLSGKNLIILDDAQNDLHKDRKYLPDTKHWEVLITSRIAFPEIKEYRLDFLTGESAIELFYTHYKIEKDDTIVKDILSPVNYHTLTTELFA